MNKTPVFIAVFSVSAAVLAGCGSKEVARDDATYEHKVVTPSTSVPATSESARPPESPEPEPSPSFGSDWAEKQLQDFMTYAGANSLKAFSPRSPEGNITAVTSPEDGVVRFEVADLDYETDDYYLDGLAVNYMSWVGCAADDVDEVIVETVGGGESVTRDGCY